MTTKKVSLIMCWFLSLGMLLQAQVTIGLDKQANVGALLDLKEKTPTNPSTDNTTSYRGLGLTRVNLTSQNNLFPMFDNNEDGSYSINGTKYNKADEDLKHIGLMVYNVGSTLEKGLYVWNGSEWRIFNSQTSEKVSASLQCSAATMNPSQKIVGGTAITSGTVILLPYNQSNGGSLTGVTLTSIGNTNVKANISSSSLALGNGYLILELSGTPTIDQEAPAGITFDLTPLLKANPGLIGCNKITVGNTTVAINQTAAIGYLSLVTDNSGNDKGLQFYALECNSPDGIFSVRIFVPSDVTSVNFGSPSINIQIRNNTETTLPIMWNYGSVFGGGTSSNGGILNIPAQEWGGDNNSGSTWRNTSSKVGAYWASYGAYNGSNNGPEFRRYTWLPMGSGHKTSYEVTTMVAIDSTNPSDPAGFSPEKLKGYIRFTQVTAD